MMQTPTPLATLSRRNFQIQLLALLGAAVSAPVLAKTGADVLLANNAPASIDPSKYLVSEKLDGVRAIWDGTTLRFRSGRTIAAPAWFLAKLPKTPLDGELWMGRGSFDAVSGTVRRLHPIDAEWEKLKYLVFELPNGAGTFAERAALLKVMVPGVGWAQLQGVEQFRVPNEAVLRDRLAAVYAAGGEGLMLHLASAPYVTGRSDVLLKLKTLADAEAMVVGYVPGKGKYAGLTGALDVKTADGKRFRLGTGLSDAQRQKPPAIGSTVTYTYRDLTPSGKPRFANFLRMADEH
jgi:DNA ligase 1